MSDTKCDQKSKICGFFYFQDKKTFEQVFENFRVNIFKNCRIFANTFLRKFTEIVEIFTMRTTGTWGVGHKTEHILL
jgi:hypothetical protein